MSFTNVPTIDMVKLASAYQHGQSVNNLTSNQVKRTASDLGFLDIMKLEKGVAIEIRMANQQLYKMSRSDLEMALDYRNGQTKLSLSIKKAMDTKNTALARSISADAKKVARDLGKLIDAQKQPNDDMLATLLSQSGASRASGVSKLQAQLDLLSNPDVFNATKPIKLSEARNVYGFEQVLKSLNEDAKALPGGGAIFEMENGVITNMAALKGEGLDENGNQRSLSDSPLVRLGLRDENEVAQLFADRTADGRGMDLFSRYNTYRQPHNEAMAKLSDAQDDINLRSADLMKTDLTPDEYMKSLSAIRDRTTAMEELANDGGIDVDDAEQILDDLATVKSVEASRDRGLRDLEMLRQMRPAQYDEAQMELAQATTSTAYRAWAADHGFTSLGRVDTDANGNVDLSTYIPGRDDMPARRAFERELKRGEGNYGFRSIGTGEIIRVTIDGKVYEGERLKHHAFDPPGTMKITQAEGPPLLITKDIAENGEVELISEIPDRASKLTRRANRLHRNSEADIAAAVSRVSGSSPLSEEEAAMVEGSFILDNGRFLSEDEYNARREEAISGGEITARVVDGEEYLVTSDGQVFLRDLTDEGKPVLTPVESDPDSSSLPGFDLYSKVMAAESRRAVIYDADPDDPENADGKARFITAEDLKGDNFDFGVESFEGEPDYDPKYLATFDGVRASRLEAITPESLGLEVADVKFDASAGRSRGEEYNIGGLKVVSISAPPKTTEEIAAENTAPPRTDAPSTDKLTSEESVIAGIEEVAAVNAEENKPPVTPVPQDPKAVFAQDGDQAFKAAQNAVTLNNKDAGKRVAAYYRMAAAAGVTPKTVTPMTDAERAAAQRKLSTSLSGADQEQRRKNLAIMLRGVEAPLGGGVSPPTPVSDTSNELDIPADEAKKPSGVIAPGAGGAPPTAPPSTPPVGNPINFDLQGLEALKARRDLFKGTP